MKKIMKHERKITSCPKSFSLTWQSIDGCRILSLYPASRLYHPPPNASIKASSCCMHAYTSGRIYIRVVCHLPQPFVDLVANINWCVKRKFYSGCIIHVYIVRIRCRCDERRKPTKTCCNNLSPFALPPQSVSHCSLLPWIIRTHSLVATTTYEHQVLDSLQLSWTCKTFLHHFYPSQFHPYTIQAYVVSCTNLYHERQLKFHSITVWETIKIEQLSKLQSPTKIRKYETSCGGRLHPFHSTIHVEFKYGFMVKENYTNLHSSNEGFSYTCLQIYLDEFNKNTDAMERHEQTFTQTFTNFQIYKVVIATSTLENDWKIDID